MAGSRPCDPCSRINESSPGTKWCVDCEDSLCTNCVKAHQGSKTSMHHYVVDLETVAEVANGPLDPRNECSEHPDLTLDSFCYKHSALCCTHCIAEDHLSCEKIVGVEKAAKNVKTSSMLREVCEGLKRVHASLQVVVRKKSESKVRVTNDKEAIATNISEFKALMVEKLDEIESQTLSELRSMSRDTASKIDKDVDEAETSITAVEKYLSQIEFLSKHGSNQNLFLLLNQLQSEVEQHSSRSKELLGASSDVKLVYTHPDVNKILGTVKIANATNNVTISPRKENGGTVSTLQLPSLQSFEFSYHIDGNFDVVTGIIIDRDVNLIMVDKSCLRMFNQDGKYIYKECKLEGSAWDIAYKDTSGPCVVALRTGSIQFLNNFRAQTKIKVPGISSGCGITWVNENIFVGGNNGKICVLDSNGKHLKTMKINAGTLYYLHYNDHKIFLTDTSNKVYCIGEDGSEKFTFSSKHLNGASGVVTDNQGNVYVAGYASHNIFRISPDGKSSDIVLTKEDGIYYPFGLCFSRDYMRLFVSNEDGKCVFVFNCQY